MTTINLKTFCTALGFTAVVMQGGKIPKKDAALRATGFANLIEEFCHTVANLPMPANSALGKDVDVSAVDAVIEKFKATLRKDGSAFLPQDRASLLSIYDRLIQRQSRRARRHFYDTAHDDVVANAVLTMMDEEISHDEDGA